MAKAAIKWGPRYQPVFVRPDGQDLEFITKLIEEGKLRPVVDRVFKLEDARCVLSALEATTHVDWPFAGKTCRLAPPSCSSLPNVLLLV